MSTKAATNSIRLYEANYSDMVVSRVLGIVQSFDADLGLFQHLADAGIQPSTSDNFVFSSPRRDQLLATKEVGKVVTVALWRL